ncbi:hypothetical protein HNQ59_001586 [Chitinivorax tropicus]|uniref:DUF2804 domain-containing protein n=1 Tax=Chitinivorax tropicus TaxID=714531 RepID=A0A840MI23_9PROT|nr:DUF2804 domain-containing protein [Chitinivorax tropicus]MBB5018298.1 hypothetical protein [Chitinivorax tropicus]
MSVPMEAVSMLSAPPRQVVQAGAPVAGRYAGWIDHINWQGLAGEYRRSAVWRKVHHKRWQYVAIATEQCFIGLAIVDVGWTNTAFAYLFDRQSKQLIGQFSQDGIPGLTAKVSNRPGAGTLSWFKHTRGAMRFEHRGGARYQLSLWTKSGFQIDAEISLHDSAAPLLAIGPITQGGCAHATQKTSALKVNGVAQAGGQRFVLDAGVASLDYSNGLLARETQWRWASAHAPDIGFNLQQGYFGNHENVLWLDGQLIPLGRAEFEFDPRYPMMPWQVRTDDGLLDLVFEPEGARQESKNLMIAASYYIQPIGTFSGIVKAHPDAPGRQVNQLVGVTEDHLSRW